MAEDGGAGGRIGRAVSRRLAIAIPYLWLLGLFLVPFLFVFKISLSETSYGQPPYAPVFALDSLAGLWADIRQLSFDNYAWLFSDRLYLDAYLSSLRIAAISTVLALMIGYPLAYAMARSPAGWRPILVMLVILPFWTSFLIRVYAWIGILRPEGYLNQFLLWTGLISSPLSILNTETAVYIGIVYSYLPFMVLPIYASLERMDGRLIEAAGDLGCPPWRAFWAITLPLSVPGIIAGAFLVFIPAVGEFVIPDLLGGSQTLMVGKVLWDEFFANRDWPVASAVAILLLILLVAPMVALQRYRDRAV
ncbi:ABC transporter permease subunit [Aureimonas populi]|uniref:ABC transporter permease subunit n=1 Tax=Aureimonas populi TaxID=1701758 RepID=A0ABW5CHR1_9HYPH|nr:ABC transporter permease subunit [Aureimonas populi]